MNIVILSGGSGNDSLIKGLKEMYPESDIKVIINAYDSGKSTGICRKVTDTLGVSDIRKNHIRMYQALNQNPDKRIIEFYNNRYNFTKGNEIEEISKLLYNWNLNGLIKVVERFFNNPLARAFIYNDFNVSNIIYAQMFKDNGYEKTNKFFCDLLGLDDFVILNSFDNVYINAITESGNNILDEGDIVEYKNSNDKIKSIAYIGCKNRLNPKAIESINDADFIIISTGTFWSSIYPTLDYGCLFEYINLSTAKKVWAINNTEDKDSYGVTSNDFIDIIDTMGLDLKDFTILENLDSIDSLHEENSNYNIKYYNMGNDNGKHNPIKYANAIMCCYYDLDNQYDNILFDFDDTIWSRHGNITKSIENIKLIKDMDNAIIISGNSYRSIYDKISYILGSDFSKFKPKIIADANTTIYSNNKKINCYQNMLIDDSDYEAIQDDLNIKFNIRPLYNETSQACIKYKPIDSELARDLLVNYINSKEYKSIIAKKTGKTTVDILSKNNNKSLVFDYLNLKDKHTLYIGDEIDSGNDSDIAKICTHSIHVNSIDETNIILKLLLGI